MAADSSDLVMEILLSVLLASKVGTVTIVAAWLLTGILLVDLSADVEAFIFEVGVVYCAEGAKVDLLLREWKVNLSSTNLRPHAKGSEGTCCFQTKRVDG